MLTVELLRELESAIGRLAVAQYADGRTHGEVPPGSRARVESWDAAIDARQVVDGLIAELRGQVAS